MLMWLFVLFFGLGLVLTIAGFALDIPVLNLTGTIMIFLLGLGLLQGGLDYKIGENTTYVYGDNYDGYHYDDYNGTTKVDDLNVFHDSSVDVYGHYDDAGDNRFGWLLMAMGALGFVLSLFRL